MISTATFRELHRFAIGDGRHTARDAATWVDIDPADALALTTDVDPECEHRYAAPDVDPGWWAGMAESWPTWDAFDPAAWEVPLLAALYRDEIGRMAAAALACPMHEPGDPDCRPSHGGACRGVNDGVDR